jgi:dihydroxy-acid dehydratase
MLSYGTVEGRQIDLNSVFEAVGAYKAGKATNDELAFCENNACPLLRLLLRHVHGKLHGVPLEALGMALPGNGDHPGGLRRAVAAGQAYGHEDRRAGEKEIRPSQILTEKAFKTRLPSIWRSGARPTPCCT